MVEEITGVPSLLRRRPESHKGDFGRLLVIAGSRGMSGAAVLCGSAALRGGAGLVRLAVPGEILPTVAVGNPCCMTAALPQDHLGRFSPAALAHLIPLALASDVVALGPGLGRSLALDHLVSCLLEKIHRPLVLDADGLNALGRGGRILKERPAPTIITPHPGEFARLLQTKTSSVLEDRLELAVAFAQDHNLVVVLKGHGTIVTDGSKWYRNTTGNPGMATAGSGDVLSGLLAALWAQNLEPFAAAQLAVHLHGLAGDLARDDLGEASLTASDLLDYLPPAFRKMN